MSKRRNFKCTEAKITDEKNANSKKYQTLGKIIKIHNLISPIPKSKNFSKQ